MYKESISASFVIVDPVFSKWSNRFIHHFVSSPASPLRVIHAFEDTLTTHHPRTSNYSEHNYGCVSLVHHVELKM